ncbi:LytTR family DNA-binding domain-containing protein [uncultured Tenacibaculum sp.]|uniref:LytR/AlgR family response regulator transcription factor n=1 Tax=uncultured Tenacibaculum sp. TaxID=174713 RepID=UPI00262D36F9|nr:LytTR family DNA-binding domain-containing protein [uncultured Tenacibaculum sp.]
MSKIKAIVVDDEANARENLRFLLNEFCKEVEVVSETSNVDEATKEIKKHKPELVFLDIEMPQKNGFQLLEEFSTIDFQVVFVTAYDKYAIRAFEVAALDYLLKPVDIERLQEAVKKVKKAIKVASFDQSKIEVLKANKKEIKKIAIPYKSDYAILDINDVLCIEADRMYSNLYTRDGKKYIIAKKLSHYENLLCKEKDFFRIHRSWIINLNRIEIYSKKEKEVTLDTNYKVPVSKSYKESFEAVYFI